MDLREKFHFRYSGGRLYCLLSVVVPFHAPLFVAVFCCPLLCFVVPSWLHLRGGGFLSRKPGLGPVQSKGVWKVASACLLVCLSACLLSVVPCCAPLFVVACCCPLLRFVVAGCYTRVMVAEFRRTQSKGVLGGCCRLAAACACSVFCFRSASVLCLRLDLDFGYCVACDSCI